MLLWGGLLLGSTVLFWVFIQNLMLGTAQIPRDIILDALFKFDDTSFDHLVIRTIRLPRVFAGLMVGSSLAVAGAMMQGLTRNPLASPSLLGINAGAALAVVLAVYFLGTVSLSMFAIYAMLGASIAALLVYGLASFGRRGATPLRLTLAGVVLTSFLASFTTAILLNDQNTLDQVRFWTVGSLANRDWEIIEKIAPYMLVGMVGALLLARQITTLSLGEEVAVSLGQNTLVVKAVVAGLVVLLAGGAVALAGPIGFVGLVAPHLVRPFVGIDYRWIIPYSALIGGVLVLGSDLVARTAISPQELPVGPILAMLGAPFFIGIARWQVRN